jgi:tyrosine-protein kinase Etk/Wzc
MNQRPGQGAERRTTPEPRRAQTLEQTIELGLLWGRIWSRRRTVAALVVGATILTGIVAFLLPSWYRSDAALLPPSEEESGIGLSSLLRGIGVAGVKVPTQATPADMFVAILESRGLNEEIVRRFGLQRRYRTRFLVDAVKELRRHARFAVTDAGTIQISVEDRDPKQAAAITNAYVDLLDRFNRDVRMTRGRRTRTFVEGRLNDTRDELARAEQRLASHQSIHKSAVLSREMTTAMDAAARLYAERTALQVRLGVARTYTRGQSDEITQVSMRLASLDQQLAVLPTSGLDLARLYRDVRTSEQVFVVLTAQYEQSRIEEVRDTPTIDVLDRATPPERASRPRRSLMVVAAFLLSLGVGVGYAMLQPAELVGSAPPAPAD